MKILLNKNDLNEALYKASNLGFVPTMGSLHMGHISLIKRSLKLCDKTIVSIFINPTQFNNKRDYKKYPRNYQKDLSILKRLKVNYLFMPKVNSIYDEIKKPKIKLNQKDKILCAKFRKGHFEGVIDVMDRLTDKIKPNKIFMGRKDFQQLYLVKKYLKKKYNTKIISCKTIRNSNNLALSSRNILLKKDQLILAGKLASDIISFKKRMFKKKIKKNILDIKKSELIQKYKVKIEYFELRNLMDLKNSSKISNSNFFISYFINNVRLIDNF